MRYRISPHIEFNKVLDDHEVIITDLKSQASFYINSTIQTFIQKFETPKTFKELTAEISKELCIAANRVKQIITPFFNYCKYRQFILPEKADTTVVIQKPLFAVKDIIDVYSIEKVIDATNDADIYMAADTRSKITVVVKLLKNISIENVIALKREYDFLLQLNDTHITPKALAFHKNKYYCYFVQEFAGGVSLPDFISHNKHAAKKHIISIATEIIDAFAIIHNKGIVHGDIHPSNIIVTADSNIKVLDFGLALRFGQEKNAGLDFGGAYFFMPPERIKKTTYKKFTKPPDFFSDVFQLGIVLFKLFYDAYPFNGITWEELAGEIKEKPINFPEHSVYGFIVPGTIRDMIKKCVAKKKYQRFKDAIAMQAFSLKNSSNAHTIRPAVKI